MTKAAQYKTDLQALSDPTDYLLTHSGLPGPRSNLELLQVFVEMGSEALFDKYAALGPELAPTGSREEYLAACGTVGLGRLLAEGQSHRTAQLHSLACDPRWRVREAVAMALQRLGDANIDALFPIAEAWSYDSPAVQRAVVAGLCEPRLLVRESDAQTTLDLLDRITASFVALPNKKDDEAQTLKKGLAYGWSVAIVAYPAYGKALFEKWLGTRDKDLLSVLKENLKKNRLIRMDSSWVQQTQSRLEASRSKR